MMKTHFDQLHLTGIQRHVHMQPERAPLQALGRYGAHDAQGRLRPHHFVPAARRPVDLVPDALQRLEHGRPPPVNVPGRARHLAGAVRHVPVHRTGHRVDGPLYVVLDP